MKQICLKYSHLQGRTFYNGALFNFLQPDSFFTLSWAFIYKTQFNLTISSHLPGLLDYCRTLKLRTFYNSDGLIKCLRQRQDKFVIDPNIYALKLFTIY